jgi:hypothetical protein
MFGDGGYLDGPFDAALDHFFSRSLNGCQWLIP